MLFKKLNVSSVRELSIEFNWMVSMQNKFHSEKTKPNISAALLVFLRDCNKKGFVSNTRKSSRAWKLTILDKRLKAISQN